MTVGLRILTKRGRYDGMHYHEIDIRNGRKIEKNHKEVEIINLIFSLGTQGKSGRKRADYLNGKGYSTRNVISRDQRQLWAILAPKELCTEGIYRHSDVRGIATD